ncbi:MAG TPA: tetratricopeptide repeat protein [Bryobacteraceae bacterium]|nr:tetratricopeptide repeat protein [Bryobacteraceae bacterium]
MPKASGPVAGHPPQELVRQQLDTILASESFRNATRLSRFLRYAVEESLASNAEVLKEHRIGLKVFGRKTDYDTRTDPVVRVEARQLRFKLADYYSRFGTADDVIISLPKGGYAAHFEWRSEGPDAATEPSARMAEFREPSVSQRPEPNIRTRRYPARTVILVALAAAAIVAGAITLAARRGHPLWGSMATDRSTNAEAHELYLKGRYYWDKRTPESLNLAVDSFTQAIVKDPGYAAAYVGLADTYNLLSEYTAMPEAEAFSRALAAAKKAVELDDRSVGAHTSLAFASFWGAWDPVMAEREYKRAIELDPNYVAAHHWYATMLNAEGRSRESLAQIERARELDPASATILADKAVILFKAVQKDRATAILTQLAESEPSFISTHRYLAFIYLAEENFDAYLSELGKVAGLSHDQEQLDLVSTGERAYAAGGGRAMLEAMQQRLAGYSSPERPRNYEMAQLCALLGENKRAIEYLQAAIGSRESSVLDMASAAEFAGLHKDPGWNKLLNQIRAARRSQ